MHSRTLTYLVDLSPRPKAKEKKSKEKNDRFFVMLPTNTLIVPGNTKNTGQKRTKMTAQSRVFRGHSPPTQKTKRKENKNRRKSLRHFLPLPILFPASFLFLSF